jgi:hypothetical protein
VPLHHSGGIGAGEDVVGAEQWVSPISDIAWNCAQFRSHITIDEYTTWCVYACSEDREAFRNGDYSLSRCVLVMKFNHGQVVNVNENETAGMRRLVFE